MSEPEFSQEKRFAVVMYGGVSLAIYMNGIAQELYRLVRSTADLPDEELSGTEKVYRQIAKDLDAKFVVDILAGTSAGGINAVFLAKALVTGQPFKDLEQLWVREGDLGVLLNDGHSISNTKALLNGTRMYEILLEALKKMQQAEGSQALVDEMDLFVTATDLQGKVVPIRLTDELVYERQHKSVFHFRKRRGEPAGSDTDDFADENNPFLAFAARCSSSFPFAFEPVRLKDLCNADDISNNEWSKFFRDHLTGEATKRYEERSLADGGYLDNKPFSYAIEAIAERQANVPVDRKLIYIEPAPERLEKKEPIDPPPDALSNVLLSFAVARYETIQEDLLLIRRRNRLIERSLRILRGTDEDILKLRAEQQPPTVADWLKQDLSQLGGLERIAYAGYLRLRVARLTDEIAGIIARQAGFDLRSDEYTAVRYLVRVWRDDRFAYYIGETSQLTGRLKQRFNTLIYDLDLGFNLRRLSFVLSKIDQLLGSSREAARIYSAHNLPGHTVESAAAREMLLDLRRKLGTNRREILALRARLLGSQPQQLTALTEPISKLGLGSEDMVGVLTPATDELRREEAWKIVRQKSVEIETLYNVLTEQVAKARDSVIASKIALGLLAGNTAVPLGEPDVASPERTAQWLCRFYFRMFSHYDMVSYPILQTPELGEEIDHVEVIRVRPDDPKQLGGSKLGHFGAFADRVWRKHDILRGRFHAAESILTALLPDLPDLPATSDPLTQKNHATSQEERRQARKTFVSDVREKIMSEVLKEKSERLDLLGDVLLGPTQEDRSNTEKFLSNFRGLSARDKRAIENLLVGATTWRELYKSFAEYTVREEPDPELTVATLARATRVTGKMLHGIADQHEFEGGKKLAGRVATAGAIAAALVESALPTKWWHLVLRRWLQLVTLLSVLLLAASAFLKQEGLFQFGVVLLGGSAAIHVVSLSVRRAVRIWRPEPFKLVAIAVLVVLLLIGAFYVPQALRDVVGWFNTIRGG